MKTIVALFVALVILLPVSGNATTLTITSGSAFLNQGAVAGSGPSLILFGGNGFSVFMMREPSFFGDLSPAFSGEPFVKSMQFYSSFFGGLADVRVGTEQCFGIETPRVTCGDITFTSPGFAMPANWPDSTPFVATVPFSATGQLLVGGNQYDLVGQGAVTGTRCVSPCGPFSETLATLDYTFSVGEPPSFILMLASSIGLGIGLLVRRRFRSGYAFDSVIS